MIIWRKNLYLGESVRDQRWKIIHNVRKRKFQKGIYLIALASNGVDTFDLIPAFMLSPDGYKGNDIEILGIASGKDEAAETARDMIQEVWDKTGGVDVRGYFS